MGEAYSFLQHEKTSQLLTRLINELIIEKKVSFSVLTNTLQRRSFAGLFLILAILSFLPGVSILAGVVMILPSLQLAIGKKTPSLPNRLDRLNVSVKHLNHGFRWLLPKLNWLEGWVKPRWLFFSSQFMPKIVGLIALVLAIIIAVPFPLSNFLPAIAMLFIAVGMLEKDGVCIAIGLAISSVAIGLSLIVVKVLYFSLEHFLIT